MKTAFCLEAFSSASRTFAHEISCIMFFFFSFFFFFLALNASLKNCTIAETQMTCLTARRELNEVIICAKKYPVIIC